MGTLEYFKHWLKPVHGLEGGFDRINMGVSKNCVLACSGNWIARGAFR